MSRKRCGNDEKDEDIDEIIKSVVEITTTSTAVSAAPAVVDAFMPTPEFRRHFVDYVPVDALMAQRLAMRGWNTAADALIDEGVENGTMMVHNGNDISLKVADARLERMKLVTRVIFLLNITKVGENACWCVVKIVVVDIPSGVESIGGNAFWACESLTTVFFPTTLRTIGDNAFYMCSSLDNVNLLHTNLQEIGQWAFAGCSGLKSMTIPDSLKTLGQGVFRGCSKLVPSYIHTANSNVVVAYLRSQQLLSSTPPAPPTDDFMHTPEFKRHFVEFVHVQSLMNLRLATKAGTLRSAAADALIDEGVQSDSIIVHSGKDIREEGRRGSSGGAFRGVSNAGDLPS